MRSRAKPQTQPSLRKRLIERIALGLLLLGICSVAIARLAPPTPEEQAQADAKTAKAAADAETEKTLLAKAQDRIAARYHAEHKTRPSASADAPQSSGSNEVPSASLNSRPHEKAGSYNEAVTPQSAPGASQGTKSDSAATPQNESNPSGS